MDLFDSAADLEQSHIEEGAADGRREGLRLGLVEGRELGLGKGFEIGLEVGTYAGCVAAWRALAASQPGAVPDKVARSIAAMEAGLAAYPLYDPQDERLHELLEVLRGKYKTVAAGLGRGGAGGGEAGASSPTPAAARPGSGAGAGAGQQQESLEF